MSEKYNKKDFGSYCDDGLGVVKNKMGWKQKKIKKNVPKIFKENKLDIVTLYNMKIVNYLVVLLNLSNSNYKLYQKPCIKILYIHKDSNNLLKIMLTSIEKGISFLPSKETIFRESKVIYQKVLEKSKYRKILKYHAGNENANNNKQNRKRNIIWCNPPLSFDVKTKVRNYFLNPIKRIFPHVTNLVNCSIVTRNQSKLQLLAKY